MAPTLCRPRWLDDLRAAIARDTSGVRYTSGCGRKSWSCGGDSKVIYDCPIDDMTARVNERWGTNLNPDEYLLARNLASEADGQGILAKVAIAEAGVNDADLHAGGDLITRLTRNTGDGIPYASGQCGQNPTASTAQDPGWDDIVIAQWVLAGKTLDFARGATLYFAPGGVGDPHRIYADWSKSATWVGRLPGISTYDQMFFSEDAGPAGPDDYQAGLDELDLALGPTSTNVDPDSLEPCGITLQGIANAVVTTVPGGKITLAAVGLAGLAGLAWWRWRRG